jgi:hypothetical protein
MVDVHRVTRVIDGRTYEISASLNNCSGLWTAVVWFDGRIVGNGAGYSPEEAVNVAVALLAAQPV